PFEWALAGYGAGGRTFHQPLISSTAGLRLVAVVTGSAARQAQVRADLPAATAVGALSDLLALGVRGVTITTPSATHAALAHEALDLGLHVVLDKPFALTAADARKLVDHAEAVGLLITPYQNRRWDSDLRTVQKLIADGMLGEVHSFTSRIDRFRPVKGSWHGGTVEEGGGTLLDLGPHLVDQALYLFGPVVSVHAQLRTVRDGAGADDVIELHLRHAGGVDSTLAGGMASAAPGPRFQVNGTLGGFVIDGFDVQEEQLKSGASPATLGAGWGVEPESAWGRHYDAVGSRQVRSERGAWDSYYPAVAAAIAGDGPLPVDPVDAIATAVVLDASRESAATGRVVTLG
ncbi:MAG: Gfo/Idh/MocA family oxidoreductase, partial [Nakamurella sp.]